MGLLQEQPGLGVHALGFGGRNLKEQRVERVDIPDKTAPLAVVLAPHSATGVEVLLPVPALGGNFSDAVAPFQQVLPELLEAVGLGITATEPDDGDIAGTVASGTDSRHADGWRRKMHRRHRG
ncbi:hypothetical protein D3C84_238490 [compost metagenome]